MDILENKEGKLVSFLSNSMMLNKWKREVFEHERKIHNKIT